MKKVCVVTILFLSLVSLASANSKNDSWAELLELSAAKTEERVASENALRERQGVGLGTWYCVGPFKPELFGNIVRVHETAFGPEEETLKSGPNLSTTWEATPMPGLLNTTRRWSKHPEWTDGYRHLLPRGPAPSRNETVYLHRTITAKEAASLSMDFLAEDFVTVYINGEKLGTVERRYGPSRAPSLLRVDLPLKAGENRLLVKISSQHAAHGFAFALEGLVPGHPLKPLEWPKWLRSTETNFYQGNQPYASARKNSVAKKWSFSQEDVSKEVAEELGLSLQEVKSIISNGPLFVSVECMAQVRRHAAAKRRLEEFRSLVTMTPMYDPPRSKMAEMQGRQEIATDAARDYSAQIDTLRKRVGNALETNDTDKMVAAASAIESFWRERIVELPPIAFIQTPAFTVNAIAPYASTGALPASICVFDPAKPNQPPRIVFHNPEMAIFDMNISFDAKTILFSARRGKMPWNIYEIGLDGKGLRQITSGDYDDISPCELPNSDIAFVSTRANTWVQCQTKRAALIYSCKRDGSGVRLLSANIDSDHTPQVTNDGRIMFTRWDYGVEKNVFARHAVWTMNPDGTSLKLFFGNTIEDPAGFWQARPIPGRPEVVSTFGPHHSYHAGMMGVIWDRLGPEAPRGEGYRFITSDIPNYNDTALPYGYQDPFPIHERLFLVSFGGDGGHINRLYLVDDMGNRKCVYEAKGNLGCWSPLLVRPQEHPPVIASQIEPEDFVYRDPEEMNQNPDNRKGTLIVRDVYEGIKDWIKPGEARYIAVMEQVQKSRCMAGGEAWGHTPIISRGTVHARRFLGLVPIEQDGSAHFTVPALRSISLNVLNADGKTLMRMGSDMHIMPGERQSCIGCHENRGGALAPPPSGGAIPIASRKPAVDPKEPNWGTKGLIDYQKVVQPVWDKYCVECHGGPKPEGGMSLTGDRTRFFSVSYDNLVERGLVDFTNVFSLDHDETAPLTVGAVVSNICEYIDTDEHSGHKITAEEKRRIYVWIDANVPYYPTYDYTEVRGIGARDSWETNAGKDTQGWLTKGVWKPFEQNCMECHTNAAHNQALYGTKKVQLTSKIWQDRGVTGHGFPNRYPMSAKVGPELRVNLTNPAHSLILQAPLSPKAGGLGYCKYPGGTYAFESKEDDYYQTMLRAITLGSANLYARPRIDMDPEHVKKVRAKSPSVEEATAALQKAYKRVKILSGMKLSEGLTQIPSIRKGTPNLAKGAKATSPDDAPLQGTPPNVSIQAAIDGNNNTFWDDVDNSGPYRLKIEMPSQQTISAISIQGWKHHDFAPKSFSILCDDKEIGRVKNAEYENNTLILSLPKTKCKQLELVITTSYGGSPGIRELEIY